MLGTPPKRVPDYWAGALCLDWEEPELLEPQTGAVPSELYVPQNKLKAAALGAQLRSAQ